MLTTQYLRMVCTYKLHFLVLSFRIYFSVILNIQIRLLDYIVQMNNESIKSFYA